MNRRQLIVAAAFVIAACPVGAPTIPLPPPVALTSAPSPSGTVTVSGTGAAIQALISVYNENSDRGVIQPADDDGNFEIEIAAEVEDSLLVWQSEGADRSAPLSLVVPDN